MGVWDIASNLAGGNFAGAAAAAGWGASGADDQEALWGNATEDAPPPDDRNFVGGESVPSGAATAFDWTRNPNPGDLSLPSGPSIALRTGGGRSGGGGAGRSGSTTRGDLLYAASAAAGFNISSKSLIYMLRKWGVPAVVALTKLSAEALLWLWMTRTKRGSRGPHLRTVVKRVRQGQRYQHLLSKYSAQVRAPHRRGQYRPFARRRRRKR